MVTLAEPRGRTRRALYRGTTARWTMMIMMMRLEKRSSSNRTGATPGRPARLQSFGPFSVFLIANRVSLRAHTRLDAGVAERRASQAQPYEPIANAISFLIARLLSVDTINVGTVRQRLCSSVVVGSTLDDLMQFPATPARPTATRLFSLSTTSYDSLLYWLNSFLAQSRGRVGIVAPGSTKSEGNGGR